MSDAQRPIDIILGLLAAGEIPGGCDHCDAYQTVHSLDSGQWKITVHHDDWCKRLASINKRGRRHAN